MKKVDLLFNEYAESHQNASNKLIHWFCVPLIFFSILGLVSFFPSPRLCSAEFLCVSLVSLAAVILVLIFYVRLSWKIALIMGFLIFFMELLVAYVNRFTPYSWLIFFLVFTIFWLGQFYGHRIEGKKPSFLKDLQFLLIGPIWLLSFILKKINLKY